MSSSEVVAPQSLDMSIKADESPKKLPEHPEAEFEPVLKLDKLEEGLRHEDFSHDTEDREDHTFCGIMVDVSCSATLPCEYVEVNSVWVRGALGPMTVYTSEKSYHECMNDEEAWTVRHKGEYESSFHALVELKLEPPLRVLSGEKAGLYVHSTRQDDQAVVYDNMHHSRYADDDYEDEEDEDNENKDENDEAGGSGAGGRRRRKRKPALSISIGQAALSDSPFGGYAPWGAGPWRRQREFVGRVSYGVRWMLWTPELHSRFPLGFRAAAEAMLMGAKRQESPLYCLRDEVIFYIMNRCGWEWFGSEFEPSQEEEDEDKLPQNPAFRLFGGQGHRLGSHGNNQAVLQLLHSLGMHAVQLNGDGGIVLQQDDSDDEEEEEDAEYMPGIYDESSDEDEDDVSDEDEGEEDVGGNGEPDADNAAEEVMAGCPCSSGHVIMPDGDEAGTSPGA